jgi:hypothetical protein
MAKSKQKADPTYLHAIDPNFAQTGFTLGDLSKLKTVSVIDPYAIPDEYGNLNNDFSYQEDPYGQRVAFSANQGFDNEGNPQGSPEYRQLTNVGGKQVQVIYDEKGNFKNAWGDDITVSGHKYTPIYDQRGNIIKYEDAGGNGFADFATMVALSALTALTALTAVIAFFFPRPLPGFFVSDTITTLFTVSEFILLILQRVILFKLFSKKIQKTV